MHLVDISLVLKGKSEDQCEPWLRSRISGILKLPGTQYGSPSGFVNAEWWLRDPDGKKEKDAVLYTVEFKVDSKENVDAFMKEDVILSAHQKGLPLFLKEAKEEFGNLSHSTRVFEFVQDFFDPEKLAQDLEEPEEAKKPHPKSKSTKPVPPPAGKKPPAPPPAGTKPPPNRPPSDAAHQPPIFDRSAKGLSTIAAADVISNPALTKLNLMRNQLDSLPDELHVLELLEIVDISHNNFTRLPEVLSKLPSVSQLDMTDNRLTVDGLGSVGALQNLTKVSFFDNGLTDFPVELAQCIYLAELNLGRNRISSLPSAIQTLTNLQKLNLTRNNLTSLPPEIGYCVNLINLNVDKNGLTALPAELTYCYILMEVSFKSNQIKSLPEEYRLERFQQLQVLDLSGNEISELPESFFELSSEADYIALQELSLQGNKLKSLPASIQNAAYLSYLNLSKNQLTQFPNICQLSSLIQVKLGSNGLTSVPAEIAGLHQLETLDLFNNRLAALPPSLFSMPIIQLYLSFNQLEELGEMNMEDLEELVVSHNKLTSIPASILNSRRLKELYANGNNLRELPPGLDTLSKFDFSHNRLTEIPASICAMKDPQSILFSHNQLTALPPLKSDSLQELFVFDVSHNKIEKLDDTWIELASRADLVVEGNPCTAPASSALPPARPSSRWEVLCSEIIGRRPTQEDAFLVAGQFQGKPNVDLFGVFDGHAGSVAARFAAKHFPETLAKQGVNRDGLVKSFPVLNAAIETVLHSPETDLAERHCGTTALVCLLDGRRLLCANVGDTRAVISRGGKAERLSLDHKPRTEVERIRSVGGHVVVMAGETERINSLLAVARSLGDYFMKPYVSDEPYLREYELTDADEFLILACDGVWDELSDQEAVNLYRAEPDPGLAAEKLRDFAYGCGSDDNISVLVVDFRHKK